MGKVMVIGSSNTDMVITTAKIPVPGETIMGNDFSIIPGGKGANQAVAAARAGSETIFITKTGDDDFGRKALEGYKLDKINTDKIFVDPDTPSGVAVIIVDITTGQNSIVVAPGSNSNLTPENIRQIEPDIIKSDVLLVQLEIPIHSVESALKIASENNVKTILDPAPAQNLTDHLLAMVDIITPNESETFILTGIHPDSEENTKKAGDDLLKKVKESVIITLGGKGVYYCSKKNGAQIFIPTREVKAVDTTAAGDVFNGYLAAELANGKNLIEAIEMANQAATYSVCHKGAQTSIPYLKDLL